MEPLADHLLRNAAIRADAPALIDGPVTLSHAELAERVWRLAAALRADGAPGRVLIALPSSSAVVVSHYAGVVAGVETLLVDAHGARAEWGEILAAFEPQILVTQPQVLAALLPAFARGAPRVVLLPDGSEPPRAAAAYAVHEVAWTGPETVARVDHSDMNRPSLVLRTTGTTERPKYVALTQRNVLAAARNINAFVRIDAAAREVTPLPLSRSFGLGRARCLTMVGGTLIVAPPRGDRALALIRQHQATGFSAVPAFFRMLIRTFGARLAQYFAGLEYMEIGSAPMEHADKLFLLDAAPGARICMHYGLTEASRSAFIEFRAERDKLDTIGRAAPHVALRVVGEDGMPCALGEIGEIVVRGEHVCAGYWRDAALTAERLRDGWLRTNDRGSLDADGYVRLIGRMDDVMNVGGIKVSPERIEGVARGVPGVIDCAAVGRRDPKGIYGEVPFLYVVSDRAGLSAQTVQSYCAAHLRPEEVPQEVVFIDAIPRTDTGKVQRVRLRAVE